MEQSAERDTTVAGEVGGANPGPMTDRGDGASRTTPAAMLGTVVETFERVRARYVDATDAAKDRIRPIGDNLRRGQLRFLAGTDRVRAHLAAVPLLVRRVAGEPDARDDLRRRLGGVGIAAFTVLAIGILAVVRPAGRAGERSASGPRTSSAEPTTAPARQPGVAAPAARPTTASTSPSTTIPGAAATPVPARAAGTRRVPGPAGGTGTAVIAASVTTAPAPGEAPGSSVSPTVPATAPATNPTTPSSAPGSTTTAPSSTPASTAPASLSRPPVLTVDLVAGRGDLDGLICLFGIDLFRGGSCTG